MQSTNIPSSLRNPNAYTQAEVLDALQGVTGSRKLSFRYELLDENNQLIRELDTVTSASVAQNWLADIKRTARFSLRSGFQDPIDYLKHRIKPWARLHMPPKAIPLPAAALPPAPETPPKFGGMTDTFDSDAMTAVWSSYEDGAINTGGFLHMPVNPNFPAARSNATWSLTGSHVTAELVRIPALGSVMGVDSVSMTMVVLSQTTGTNLMIRYRKVGPTSVNKLEFCSNVSNTDAGAIIIDYDPLEHRWLQIRESGGTVFWETSRTGFPGTWQIQRSLARPAWVVTDDNQLRLLFQAVGNVDPDDFGQWDNLNLTPTGVETPFMPLTDWSNNFNGTPGVTGEAITTNNSARHGNALDNVIGIATYDSTHTFQGGKSAKLGDDAGTSDGVLVARVRNALTQWSMRYYFWVQTGGFITVQPDGANPNTASDMVFDQGANNVTLGSISVPAALRSNFFGRLVKVEVVTTETLTIYRIYWTDATSSSPDYVTSESNVGRDPLLTVTVVGGGSTTLPSWFDNFVITKPQTFQRFTDDSVNWVEWPQGVFLLSSPQRQTDSAQVTSRDIDGYDLGQILHDDLVYDRFSTANLLRVNDNFTRAVTGSWGTSADGTIWVHNTVANTVRGVDLSGYAFVRIGDDSGLIRLSQAGNSNQETLVDSEVYTRMGVSQLSSGNSLLGGIIFRLSSSSNYYRLRVEYTLAGAAVNLQVTSTNNGTVTQYSSVSAGLTYSAGEYFNVRAQCVGHIMRAKIWRSGAVEPAGWLIEDDVPLANQIAFGYTGVSGSNFTGNTNTNAEHRFDQFQLNPNPGNTYTGVVDHLLTEANIPKRITASQQTLPTVKEWEAGTSKLQIVNDLLSAINYESISFDEDGFAIVKPYVSPQDRAAEFSYQDNDLSVIYPEMVQEYDLFSIPNRWILTVSDPDRDAITVDFTNMDPASPTSTVRRGRTITSFVQEEDSDSEATLIQKASRLAFESSQVFEAVEFSTGIMPIHSGNDVYSIVYDALTLNSQYSEVSWDMELKAGSKMTHRARRIISLVAANDPSIIDDDVQVTGAVQAGNIAAGIASIVPIANKPVRVSVTGLNLQGRGPVRVIATAESAVPGSQVREVTTADHTPYGFSLWLTRTNTTTTNVHWLAIRGA